MCGRFTLTCGSEKISEQFQLSEVPEITPRYNIAPTQWVATVSMNLNSKNRQFNWMRWGLIPRWAKDQKMGAKLINARVETVTEKPSFRHAIRQQRCLIVADGFYEWQKQKDDKQPYYLHLENHQPFAFAGLWERWKSPDNEDIISCTILTTEASQEVRSIHHRQPIIISENSYSQWLNPHLSEPQEILLLLVSQPTLNSYQVNAVINNPRHDEADCIERK